MRLALAADDVYPVTAGLWQELERRGHDVVLFGGDQERPWAHVAEEAALSVARGACEEGIFLCWSGTGISIAANKVPGVFAALCHDAGSARAARKYNRANVLCLAARSTTIDIALEILDAWFAADFGDEGLVGSLLLREVDARHRTP